MAKVEKIKEILNSLRVGLSIISALIITLGGTLGNLYKHNEIDFIFWVTAILFFIAIFISINLIHKIKIYIDKLEDF